MRRVRNFTTGCLMSAVALAATGVGLPRARAQTAIPTGVTVTSPVAKSTIAPSRMALILAPAFNGGSFRNALAQADAGRYRDLLGLLGFDVTLVVPQTRLTLELAVRSFADTIAPTTEVAVFALGPILPKGDDLYVMVSDAATPRLDTYATEGLTLGEILKQIASRAPKETVVVVDECHESAGQTCRVGAATFPDATSAIVGTRAAPDA